MSVPQADDIYSSFRKHIRSFATCSEDTWQLLESVLEVHNISKGANILTEGKICRHIDFIHRGAYRAFSNKNGTEVTTGIYLEGGCVTNMKSLSMGAASHLYIQALENCIIVRLYKERLIGLYDLSPELQSLGRSILEGMIIQENEWKEMYTLYDPEERYNFLLNRCPEMVQRVSLQYVASFLGIRRETLSRIRGRSSRRSF